MPTTKSIDWDSVPDLGDVPDRVIADRLGVTPSAVAYQRRKRGIQPTRDLRGRAPSPGRPRTSVRGPKVAMEVCLEPRQRDHLERSARGAGVSMSVYMGQLLDADAGADDGA